MNKNRAVFVGKLQNCSNGVFLNFGMTGSVSPSEHGNEIVNFHPHGQDKSVLVDKEEIFTGFNNQ